jgi:hypothetical protein
MYEGLLQGGYLKFVSDWETSSSSLYKSLFAEYFDLRANVKKYATMFAKLDVLNLVGKQTYINYRENVEKIESLIADRYPMLTYVGYGSTYDKGQKSKAIIAYIEQIDGLISRAVKEAVAESAAKEVENA